MMSRLAGVKAEKPYSHQGLEVIAGRVRQTLEFGSMAPINPLLLFEDMHQISIKSEGKDVPLYSGIAPTEQSEGYARYDARRDRIEVLVSISTYEWLERKHPRAAFTIAHELGHCLLHTNQLMHLAQMPTKQLAAYHRGERTHPLYQDTEWQANAFAGALLMPAAGIAALEKEYGRLSALLIQDKFQVSYEAAGYRLDLYTRRKGELLRV